jgi:cell division protein FtsB
VPTDCTALRKVPVSTRQKRNGPFGGLILPAICLLLMSYFSYHAITGNYGTQALVRLRDDTTRLEFDLAGLKSERQKLEARVLLLHDGTLEADMLDERARYTLNLLAPDEVVLKK